MATFTVTTLVDENDAGATVIAPEGTGLSLREALALASGGGDTIVFDPGLAGGTLTLTNGQLDIASNVTVAGDIDGNGTADITIDAAGNSRVLSVGAVTATVDGLVITGGNSIYGGGIDNAGNLTVSHSAITGNHVGGGIHNVGTLTLEHVTVSGNTSDGDGGGIANALSGAILHVIDSTISNNTAAFNGGGLVNPGGDSATLTNVTMFGNTAGGGYGGGAIYSGGDLTLTQVTITGNHADFKGGGVYVGAGDVTITNTIIAGNDAGVGDDVFEHAPASFAGVNIVGVGGDTDGSDGIINAPSLANVFAHIAPVDPDGAGPNAAFNAGVLADNGGLVQTVAINRNGVAHDAGDDASAVYDDGDDGDPATPDVPIPTDARGEARVADSHVDIGAFEAQPLLVTTLDDDTYGGGTLADEMADGNGLSLREALALANAEGGADAITFAANLKGGALYLTSGQELRITTDGISINGDIDGDGTPDITISAASALGANDATSRVFNIDDSNDTNRITGTLNGLVIRDGKASDGGGIILGEGDQNVSGSGDAIRLSNSSVIGNTATFNAGGIFGTFDSAGTLTNVTISDNHARYGGGLYVDNRAQWVFVNNTISNNTAVRNGGGVYVDHFGAQATFINTTIAGNHAGQEGGGLFVFGDNILRLTNSTVTGNSADAGGGIFEGVETTLVLTNAIVAGNDASAGDDLRGSNSQNNLTLAGQNIVGSAPDGFTTTDTSNGNYVLIDGTSQSGLGSVFATVALVDPDGPGGQAAFLAGVLANNGGPVQTVALKDDPSNPAIDAGGDTFTDVPTADARGMVHSDFPGVAHNGANISDLGAFEVSHSIVVTTLNDVVDANDGLTSLREAIALANGNPGADTITFDSGLTGGHNAGVNDGRIVLAQGELVVSTDVTINGDVNGDHKTDIIVDGDSVSRVFHVSAGTSRFDAVAITGGSATSGGGFLIDAGADVTISRAELSANYADTNGGAIDNAGTLTVSNSALAANSAYGAGGALNNHGTATLTNVTLFGNDADTGGAVFNAAGDLTITQSTITGNYAYTSGGGIFAGGSIVTPGHFVLTNTIVAGNDADDAATDLYVAAGADNTHTGVNIFHQVGAASGSDITAADLHDVFAHVSHNPFTHVLSGELNDNGGPTPTVAINEGGLAPDVAGADSAVPAGLATDARGFDRVAGAHVDVGAVELQAGQSFVVTTLHDELDSNNPNATLADFGGAGDLSLREALVLAQHDPLSVDTITFASTLTGGANAGVNDGHLTLTQGALVVAGNVTIDGDVNGDHTADITVDANASGGSVFNTSSGTSTLHGLVMTGGVGFYGGGIAVGNYTNGTAADVTVSDSIVRDNIAIYGGGIGVGAGSTLHLINSTVTDNHAVIGGGIAITDGGTMTAVGVTVSHNNALSVGAGYGGGIANEGTATLTDSTISGNRGVAGGGIYDSGDLTLTNVTIANNSADYGGGLYTTPCGCATATLLNTTISGNFASQIGGGIYHYAGTLNLTNTIVAGNGAGDTAPDLAAYGTVNYAGANLFSQAGVGRPGTDIYEPNIASIFASVTTIDPDGTPNSGDEFIAGVLANNGGHVQTIALAALPENPALDASDTTAPLTDARGFPREDFPGIANAQGSAADLGAFELQDDPVAQAGFASGDEDTIITGALTVTGAAGPLTFSRVTQAAHGNVTVNADGTFTYTPDANFNGADSFSFKANDGLLDSNVAIESLTVNAVSDIPTIDGGFAGDLSGDGKSDIVIHNVAGGVVYFWQMDGVEAHGTPAIGSIGAEWHFADNADFNGDGIADILWRADDGSVLTWQIQNSAVQTGHLLGQVGNEWHIGGTGDFDGNGADDILWQRDDGTLLQFQMQNGVIQSAPVFGQIGTEWHNVGIGDFNGDGKSDILWRGDDGTLLDFQMNGAQIDAQTVGQVGREWHVEGVADFNADGKSDILWQADSGELMLWEMNGSHIQSSQTINGLPPDWHLSGTADVDGDHKADILWRQDSGDVAVWEMDGASVTAANVITPLDATWAIGVHHYDLL